MAMIHLKSGKVLLVKEDSLTVYKAIKGKARLVDFRGIHVDGTDSSLFINSDSIEAIHETEVVDRASLLPSRSAGTETPAGVSNRPLGTVGKYKRDIRKNPDTGILLYKVKERDGRVWAANADNTYEIIVSISIWRSWPDDDEEGLDK